MPVVLLSQLKSGDAGIVLDFENENLITQRMEEMGLTPGQSVEVLRFAPLGDPIEIKIRGYLLTLRREEAEQIRVQTKQSY